MNHPPLISVLIPVRDEDATIGQAIDSVLRQTWHDLEVIVIDGDSSDATIDVVADLQRRDHRVRLAHNPRRIIPTALNIGLAEARGAYVLRVDAHWTINDTYVATAVSILESSPDIAAVGGRRNGTGLTSTGQAIACALANRFGVGNSLYHYGTEPQDTDHASGGMYRAGVLGEVGGWDEDLLVNEDVDLDHRILTLGYRIRFEPRMVSQWRVRESLIELARQYRRYGRGKARMVRKNGLAAIRLRHAAAPALVASLPVTAAAALAGRRRTALALGAPYPLAVVAASTFSARRQPAPRPRPVLLAGAFAAMHLGWGLGFIEGTLTAVAPAASSGRLHGAEAATSR